MKNIDKLAMMFQERENKQIITATIGEVLSMSPPRIKYGDNIILDRHHLVFSSHVLSGYSRTVDLSGVNITGLQNSGDGSMSFHLAGSPPAQDYELKSLSLPGAQASKVTAVMQNTDTLKPGDKVILIPDVSFKHWFVVDKAVTL